MNAFMKQHTIALVIYGESGSGRNALIEEKYRELSDAFLAHHFIVKSVLYNAQIADKVYKVLQYFDAVLVWVNPVEKEGDRKKLDDMLLKLANHGCLVSAHPEVILKIGTKDIIYKTKDWEWGGDTRIYTNYDDFVEQFYGLLLKSEIRVLKQYRGNGGLGVFKIIKGVTENELIVVHAQRGSEPRKLLWNEFCTEFQSFFINGGLLIDQEWNVNHANGMVRCYLTGTKVSGFGYQEINALYELKTKDDLIHLPPGKRFYFTENCGLFDDLKQIMENDWIPRLQKTFSINQEMMPVIWDADFFINNVNSNPTAGKYTLCEINVSCVSPFPPSAIKYILEEVTYRIINKKTKAI